MKTRLLSAPCISISGSTEYLPLRTLQRHHADARARLREKLTQSP
jgi:hypothetical protein